MTETPKWKHPKIGEKVRYIGAEPGEARVGIGENPTRWIRGGAVGVVIRVIPGYVERLPGCSDGVQKDAPVVAYETREGAPVSRCIFPEDEGKDWERV